MGGDAQRTGWVRTDPRISKDGLAKGGMQLVWKRQLEKPSGQRSPGQPVLLPNIISYKGFKALAYVGGSSDTVYSIDYDLNRIFWQRSLGSAGASGAGCAASSVAVTRATSLGAATPAIGGRGAGRGQGPAPAAAPGTAPAAGAPAGTAPGTPGTPPPAGNAPAGIPAGAGAPAPPGAPPAPAPGTPAAAAAQPPAGRGGGGGGGGRGGGNNVYAVSATGMVHALNPQTGEDVNPPAKFTGGGAKLAGAVFIDNVVYAAAVENCGSVGSGVYAIDLADNANTVTSWDARGARIAGALGPAFGTDGTLYVATGAVFVPSGTSVGDTTFANAIISLEPRTLKVKDWFTAAAPFTSSPVVFTQGTRTLVAAANADGSVYVLDGTSLGGADHMAPLAKTPQFSQNRDFAAGAITTWEDAGTRWIAAATSGPLAAGAKFTQGNGTVTAGGIVAFRLAGEGAATTLEPAWSSRDLAAPGGPIVLNGVLFAVSGGALDEPKGKRGRAVLYAFDAATGKDLWNSGNAMTSFVPGIPPSAGDGLVYVVTADGTLYAFGIPLEH